MNFQRATYSWHNDIHQGLGSLYLADFHKLLWVMPISTAISLLFRVGGFN